MTFDECLEKLKSESAESKEVIERAELFAELCNEYGVEVKEGTGRIMIDGKDIDIIDVMNNPCLKCNMSDTEKAACCGCPERLEYEKQKIEPYKGKHEK